MTGSINELREICQPKTKIEEERSNWIYGWYPFLARKVSIYITKLLIRTEITANQITLMYIVLGAVGGILFGVENYYCLIVGVFILHFAMIIDFVDGEVARYKKMTSTRGKFLDDVGWELIHTITFISVGLKAYNTSFNIFGFNTYHNIWTIILTFSALSFRLLGKFSDTYAEVLSLKTLGVPMSTKQIDKERSGHISTSETQSLGRKFRKTLILALGSYNMITFLSLAVLINLPFLPVLFYGVLVPPLWIAHLYVEFIEFGPS